MQISLVGMHDCIDAHSYALNGARHLPFPNICYTPCTVPSLKYFLSPQPSLISLKHTVKFFFFVAISSLL